MVWLVLLTIFYKLSPGCQKRIEKCTLTFKTKTYTIALYLLAVDVLSVAPVPLSMIWCCVDIKFL